MLKKVRVVVSVVACALITCYFVDFAELMPRHFGWLARIQLLPAALSHGLPAVAGAWLILTLVAGRVYCSSVCPMGIMQDVVGWLSRRFGKKRRQRYRPPRHLLRVSAFVLPVALFLAGFPLLLGLLEPYSAYGRMTTAILKPAYMAGNNVLEATLSLFNNHALYRVGIFVNDLFTLLVALLTLGAIGTLAWSRGRTWCNTLCPVGALLGLAASRSLLRVRLDTDKCTRCGACAARCKAGCINTKEKRVDNSRCVTCFNCLDTCKFNAIAYAPPTRRQPTGENVEKTAARRQPIGENVEKTAPHRQPAGENIKKTTSHRQPARENVEKNTPHRQPVDDNVEKTASHRQPAVENANGLSRRRFLLSSMTAVAAIPIAPLDRLAGTTSRPPRSPIAPPGAMSIGHLSAHCTSCHLCISKCPSRVLKPAFMEYGLGGMMQPTVYYEKGFCNYNCTVCGDVCPNGAIHSLTTEQKQMTQIGRVVFDETLCIVITDGTSCGACSEHCPTQAVTMIPRGDGLTSPRVDTSICIGCGGCEYICPVRPLRAIHVEGNPVQSERAAFKEDDSKEVIIDDFGF
jgi:ferredoxin